jgi:hypothetical protein
MLRKQPPPWHNLTQDLIDIVEPVAAVEVRDKPREGGVQGQV